jgi:hypothetical protein
MSVEFAGQLDSVGSLSFCGFLLGFRVGMTGCHVWYSLLV